jgi:HJR/Mrr/RecB family endonuclease
MAAEPRRNPRRKYAKSTHDQVIFVLVILLAAAVYASRLAKVQHTRDFVWIAIVFFGLIFFITVLRKLTRHRVVRPVPHMLLNNMSGVEFEQYVASLLPSQGYTHVQLTEHYDFGLDIIAEKEGLLWGIQVKRCSAPVKLAAVRQAVAALKHYGCDRAMVITNSSFSPAAQDLAASNSCILIDGHQLMRWTKQIS